MAKRKEAEKVIEIIKKIPDDVNEIEVTNIIEAEKLQRAGWRLIDCHLSSDGKIYKFER